MTDILTSIGVQYPDDTISTSLNRFKKAIFGFGALYSTYYLVSNEVNINGLIAKDVAITGSPTARYGLAAAGYGGDKAIFAFGFNGVSPYLTSRNLVSSLGVIGSDVGGVGTARTQPGAAGYGIDKAIIGYGVNGAGGTTGVNVANLVDNLGVIVADRTEATSYNGMSAATYGFDKTIFGYDGSNTILLYNNTGVLATTYTSTGTSRANTAAACYGGDKVLFGFGYGTGFFSTINRFSNTGVQVDEYTSIGYARMQLAAAGYGGDKAIFGFGSNTSVTNLVSNTGIIAADISATATGRSQLAAAGFGS